MKALTLVRPWDWAILHGGKDIENRVWKPTQVLPFTFAIHAGHKRAGIEVDRYINNRSRRMWRELSPAGHIVGIATVYELIPPTDEPTETWHMPGQWGWRLRDVRALPVPVPCRGALSLWKVPSDVERAIWEQLAARK